MTSSGTFLLLPAAMRVTSRPPPIFTVCVNAIERPRRRRRCSLASFVSPLISPTSSSSLTFGKLRVAVFTFFTFITQNIPILRRAMAHATEPNQESAMSTLPRPNHFWTILSVRAMLFGYSSQ
jgi:hypothetical protein